MCTMKFYTRIRIMKAALVLNPTSAPLSSKCAKEAAVAISRYLIARVHKLSTRRERQQGMPMTTCLRMSLMVAGEYLELSAK